MEHTMSKRTRLAGLALLSAVALISGACASSTGSGGDIVVGATIPLSGSTASYGAIMKDGMELAINEINDAGGVDGRKLVGRYVDSQGNPSVSVGLTQQLIAAKAVAIATCFPAVA